MHDIRTLALIIHTYDADTPPKNQTTLHQNYAQGKLANILWVTELTNRLRQTHPGTVFANAAHPGLVASNFIANALLKGGWISPENFEYVDSKIKSVTLTLRLAFSVQTGALTQLFLATSPKVEEQNITGHYYVPVANAIDLDLHVAMHVSNATLTTALWKLSDELTEKWM